VCCVSRTSTASGLALRGANSSACSRRKRRSAPVEASARAPLTRSGSHEATMTILVPMTPEVFRRYAEATIKGYANENISAGRWSEHDGLERASKELNALLPQGLATPDNYLYEICSAKGGATVGYLWWAVEERRGVRGAYVYDVVIHEAFRRQGHARRTFEQLESLVASLGVSSIALHVFAHNPAAQALYEQLGFKVTGLNMLKHLSLPKA